MMVLQDGRGFSVVLCRGAISIRDQAALVGHSFGLFSCRVVIRHTYYIYIYMYTIIYIFTENPFCIPWYFRSTVRIACFSR